MTAPDVNADVRARFELWFFRDLSDAQRKTLFALCEMPVEEITCHSTEKRVLRHLLRAAHADLAGEVRELVEAGNRSIAAFEALGKAFGVIATARTRQECEAALVAQKAALAKFHPTHQETK